MHLYTLELPPTKDEAHNDKRKNAYLDPAMVRAILRFRFPAAYCLVICGFMAIVKLLAKLLMIPLTCVATPRAALTVVPPKRLRIIFKS